MADGALRSARQHALEMIERVRAKPPRFRDARITMAHGAGGKAHADADRGPARAGLRLDGAARARRRRRVEVDGLGLAMTTDSFVVKPIRFPGGSIGELAVNGTVNDLAVSGARPLALTLSLVLEEGLAGRRAARRGRGDRRRRRGAPASRSSPATRRSSSAATRDSMYVCTTGLGRVDPSARSSRPTSLRPGDRILVSGPDRRARHGDHARPRRVRARRPPVESDTRSLWPAVDALLDAAGAVAALHARRDARRRRDGAERAGARLGRRDRRARGDVPVRPAVAGACEILGIDPMYVANEGELVAFVAPEAADEALAALRAVAGLRGRGRDRRGEDGAARDGARRDGVRRPAGDGHAGRAIPCRASAERRSRTWQRSSSSPTSTRRRR